MEKKFLALLLTVMLVFSAFGFNTISYAFVAEFAGGSGTETDPWQIESAEQLNNLRNYLGPEHHNKYFKLNNAIDLNVSPYNTGAGWEPIGNWWGAEPALNDFQGTFDGDGHTISGLFINMPPPIDWEETDYFAAGLFGEIFNATIRNVVLSDVNITGQDCVGGIVGCGEKSFISGVTVTGIINIGDSEDIGYFVGGVAGYFGKGTITGAQGWATVAGNEKVGGLIGEAHQCTISNSNTKESVTGNDVVGGLVGNNYNSLIINTFSTSSVTGGGDVGGLVGYNNNQSAIMYSWTNGVVEGCLNSWGVGGLVGENDHHSTIIYSHADGSVAGLPGSNALGGLAGENVNNSTISQSFATGDVSGGEQLGGLVGINYSSNIRNSYASGGVASINDDINSIVAGLVGVNYGSTISNSYSVSVVIGSGWRHGGLIGYDQGGLIESSYSLGPYNSFGGGEVVTSEAMMMEATFLDWDFAYIWGIDEGASYPYLMYTPSDLEIKVVTPLNDINVGVGTDLAYVPLPRIVQVSIVDSPFYAYLPVVWDSGTPAYDSSTNGAISFEGTVGTVAGIANTGGYAASVNVIVDDREIVSVATLPAINVPYGTSLGWVDFPITVQVTLDDGSQTNLKVMWDGGTPEFNCTTSGIYSFTGTITAVPGVGIFNTSGYTASVDVVVGPLEKEIVSVATLPAINVSYGALMNSIAFPDTVQVTLDDASTTDVAVTWDNGTPTYDGNASSMYVFKGTLTLPPGVANTDEHTANVNVIVEPAVDQHIIVTSHPADCSVPLGESATFTVEYSGYPEPDIQWQLSTNSGKKWSDITGATMATFSIPVTTMDMSDNQYRAILYNNVGSPATTDIATLTVTYGNADVSVNLSGLYDSSTNIITWTITVTNNGPDAARGVMVSDALINGTKVQAVYSEFSHKVKGRTVIVKIGDLESGESTDITIETQLTRAMLPVENTVTMTTTSQDGDPTNNVSTFTVY